MLVIFWRVSLFKPKRQAILPVVFHALKNCWKSAVLQILHCWQRLTEQSNWKMRNQRLLSALNQVMEQHQSNMLCQRGLICWSAVGTLFAKLINWLMVTLYRKTFCVSWGKKHWHNLWLNKCNRFTACRVCLSTINTLKY